MICLMLKRYNHKIERVEGVQNYVLRAHCVMETNI